MRTLGANVGLGLALAALAAWICTVVKEDEDEHALARTASFFALIGGGTVAFCLFILFIETVF